MVTEKNSKRSAYILWPCCTLPSKNVQGSISTQSHGSIPQAHSWGGLNALQAPTPVEKKKQQQATKGTEAKKISTLRKIDQHKAAANPPETDQHEENCYKVDGYKSIHYRKHCSAIIQSVRKSVLIRAVDTWTCQWEIQQEPAQGRKVLVEKRLQNENCIKLHMYTVYLQY